MKGNQELGEWEDEDIRKTDETFVTLSHSRDDLGE